MKKILSLSILLAGLFSAHLVATDRGWTPQQLWEDWPQERFVTTPAPCLRPAELNRKLGELAERHPETLKLEEVGRSALGRPIQLLTFGSGERKVFLWSQMHGDEPSATPALLDLTDYLLSHAEQADARAILSELTLLVLPMVNPDGAELFRRRNAQDIDINRDALNLTTPEGRLLKELRDRHQPFLGFNLHDQNSRTAVGDTGVLATNAVLAVSGDPQGTVTPGRLLAKRACSAVATTLAPFMPGGMARYDEDWSPRAFGDNITAWGTPVVLIESGGLPAGHPVTDLARLNFVALLTVLRDLVRDELASHDPEIYENLLRNQTEVWSDVIVRGGSILQPGSRQPYRADLAFDRLRGDREIAGCGSGDGATTRSAIAEIGDLRYRGSGRDIDGNNALIVAPLVASIEGWAARRWLTGEVLDRFARLGVGTLVWAVPRKKQASATALAYKLRAPGRSRVEVVPRAVALPPLKLTGPPAEPRSLRLGEILRALQPSVRSDRGMVSPVTDQPWQLGSTPPDPSLPRIRRDGPASFLLLSHPSGDDLDLESASLRAVWLHGIEVEATP